MQSRIRAVMLGLLAVMLVGSVIAATASAEEAGPFWHHRPIGETKNTVGEKVEPKAPENFSGSGGLQVLKGTIAGTAVEIQSSKVQIKGAVFNSALRGQVKLELIYNQPTLIKPEGAKCTVTVGTKNIVVVKGHLMWKWNGEKKQLEEKPQKEQTPDLVFTAVEPQQQEPAVEKVNLTNNGTFTTIGLGGTGCILASTTAVSGSDVAIPNRKLEEWSTNLSLRTLEPQKEIFLQHYWDGKGYQGAEIGLRLGSLTSSLIGQTEATSAQQELSVFE